MNKPITIAKKDFENSLVELINESGLPAFVIQYILSDMQIEVEKEKVRQLKEDEDSWNRSQQEVCDVYSDGNTKE